MTTIKNSINKDSVAINSYFANYINSCDIPRSIAMEIVDSFKDRSYEDLTLIKSDEELKLLFNHFLYNDSIGLLDVVADLEKKLKINIAEPDIKKLNSFIDLAQLIWKKISE